MTDWKENLLNSLVHKGFRQDEDARKDNLPEKRITKGAGGDLACSTDGDICIFDDLHLGVSGELLSVFEKTIKDIPESVRTVLYNSGVIHVLTTGEAENVSDEEILPNVIGLYKEQKKLSISELFDTSANTFKIIRDPDSTIYHEAGHALSFAAGSQISTLRLHFMAAMYETGIKTSTDAVMKVKNPHNSEYFIVTLGNHPAMQAAYKKDLDALVSQNGPNNSGLVKINGVGYIIDNIGDTVYETAPYGSLEVSHYVPTKYEGKNLGGDGSVTDNHLPNVLFTEEPFAQIFAEEIQRSKGELNTPNLSMYFPHMTAEVRDVISSLEEIYNENPKPALTESANDPLYEQGSAFNFGR